jgi:hypothetical protein
VAVDHAERLLVADRAQRAEGAHQFDHGRRAAGVGVSANDCPGTPRP